MDQFKLFACFEATNIEGKSEHVIYSAKFRTDLSSSSNLTPKFRKEVVIRGFSSMGCGLLGSKIVFSGGDREKEQGLARHNRSFITYDTMSKQVSRKDICPMYGPKLRPLMFQLYERLYVFDTRPLINSRSFEIYYPDQKVWCYLPTPFGDLRLRPINEAISGRTPYSWFVFGNCLCICLPGKKPTYFHHAKQKFCKYFDPYKVPLPFCGMAITYYQRGFNDVVVISFSKDGRVEGRRLDLDPFLGEPQVIFETDRYEQQPDGVELSWYFADAGDGVFCLTIFDNVVNMHVYMFKILRTTDWEDGALNLKLLSLTMHKYDLSNFDNKIVGFLGCFVPTADIKKKQSRERQIYRGYWQWHMHHHERTPPSLDIPTTMSLEDDLPETPEDMDSEVDCDVM